MQCPECGSTDISKNGKQRAKQNYLCKARRRQFIESCDPPSGYSDEVKQECLKLYLNGMGFRAIQRSKGVHHTTVITWVKQTGQLLPDALFSPFFRTENRYTESIVLEIWRFPLEFL